MNFKYEELFEFDKCDDMYPILIEKNKFSDDRGYFIELYNSLSLEGICDIDFVQDNMSLSKKGVFRGLHFQSKPKEMVKYVSCLNGSIIDFIADIRPQSKTYGKVCQYYLSSENKRSLIVPAGFAHGLLVLENDTLVHYKCSTHYDYSLDSGIHYKSFRLGIPEDMITTISEKDKNLPTLKEIEKYYAGFNKGE